MIEAPYHIDVYPVTNDQYRKFLEAGGYEGYDFWSEKGRKRRKESKIVQTGYWNDPKWTKEDHPVVGVSFYEAEAYASWAGKRLPTEKEWERAARHTDGRTYPWGDAFDEKRCNCKMSGIGGTSRLDLYPNGVSEDGCYDMAGNVWEWTSSSIDRGFYVLRGGSWGDDDPDIFRCAFRSRLDPYCRYFDVGFRCART